MGNVRFTRSEGDTSRRDVREFHGGGGQVNEPDYLHYTDLPVDEQAEVLAIASAMEPTRAAGDRLGNTRRTAREVWESLNAPDDQDSRFARAKAKLNNRK